MPGGPILSSGRAAPVRLGLTGGRVSLCSPLPKLAAMLNRISLLPLPPAQTLDPPTPLTCSIKPPRLVVLEFQRCQ